MYLIKISREFRGILLFLVNFTASRPREISEALYSALILV